MGRRSPEHGQVTVVICTRVLEILESSEDDLRMQLVPVLWTGGKWKNLSHKYMIKNLHILLYTSKASTVLFPKTLSTWLVRLWTKRISLPYLMELSGIVPLLEINLSFNFFCHLHLLYPQPSYGTI